MPHQPWVSSRRDRGEVEARSRRVHTLMELSVRPGRSFAISAQRLPSILCALRMTSSSSAVHASLQIDGFRWLCHRSRHCESDFGEGRSAINHTGGGEGAPRRTRAGAGSAPRASRRAQRGMARGSPRRQPSRRAPHTCLPMRPGMRAAMSDHRLAPSSETRLMSIVSSSASHAPLRPSISSASAFASARSAADIPAEHMMSASTEAAEAMAARAGGVVRAGGAEADAAAGADARAAEGGGSEEAARAVGLRSRLRSRGLLSASSATATAEGAIGETAARFCCLTGGGASALPAGPPAKLGALR